jgi:hypothetical protein
VVEGRMERQEQELLARRASNRQSTTNPSDSTSYFDEAQGCSHSKKQLMNGMRIENTFILHHFTDESNDKNAQ